MPVAECPLIGPASSQSLVLVSRLPFVRLFQSLLSLIAPEYFEKLAPCLEAGKWHQTWPASSHLSPLEGLLTSVTCVHSL